VLKLLRSATQRVFAFVLQVDVLARFRVLVSVETLLGDCGVDVAAAVERFKIGALVVGHDVLGTAVQALQVGTRAVVLVAALAVLIREQLLDLVALLLDDVVFFFQLMTDEFLFLLEASLEDDERAQYFSQLVVSQSLLALVLLLFLLQPSCVFRDELATSLGLHFQGFLDHLQLVSYLVDLSFGTRHLQQSGTISKQLTNNLCALKRATTNQPDNVAIEFFGGTFARQK
jgi:hypothetical protein